MAEAGGTMWRLSQPILAYFNKMKNSGNFKQYKTPGQIYPRIKASKLGLIDIGDGKGQEDPDI